MTVTENQDAAGLSEAALGLVRLLPTGVAREAHDFGTRLQAEATRLGFQRLGVTDVTEFADAAASLRHWLDAGYHGDMEYMRRERSNPRALMGTARSLLVVAAAYPGAKAGGLAIASYARGEDYHRVLKAKLVALAQYVADDLGQPVLARPCVDTAPVLERAAAERAALGVTGKSTLTIVPGLGTYVLLAELLLDVRLPQLVAPALGAACGSCTRCLDACPTKAFVGPYVLDARRCISYLTIEHRGVIPTELRTPIGTHVVGCDICQVVCPYNASKKTRAYATELTPKSEQPDLVDLLQLTASGYRRFVGNSALRRLSRPQLQRNAAVALGNSEHPGAVPALIAALSNPNPLVRQHVAWALGQKGGEAARTALFQALGTEADAQVREELTAALSA